LFNCTELFINTLPSIVAVDAIDVAPTTFNVLLIVVLPVTVNKLSIVTTPTIDTSLATCMAPFTSKSKPEVTVDVLMDTLPFSSTLNAIPFSLSQNSAQA
jgi:hypothetical protein